MGQTFCLFSSFSHCNDNYRQTINEKSIDGVLGIRTWDHKMVGAGEPTEQWQPPNVKISLVQKILQK